MCFLTMAGVAGPVTERVDMLQAAFSDAIVAARDELHVFIAHTPEQVRDAQRLRYRVYCEERGFEPGADGLEQDDVKSRAIEHVAHLAGRARQTA